MSLEQLLDEEPPATLQKQANPGRVDAVGMPLHSLSDVRSVSGRAIRLSARQVEAWRTLAVEASYEFLTFDGDVQNGHFLKLSDGRLFRVTGTGARWYEKGGIPTYYKYPMVEMKLA